MPIVGLLVGAVVGLWLDRGFDVVMGGAFVGLIAGLIFGAWRKRGAPAAASAPALHPAGDRIAALELRLARVETALDRAGMMAPATALAHAGREIAESTAAVMPAVPPAASAIPPVPAYGARRARRPNPVWAWITGGNTLARVGIIVLFVGVGFLLKYATEHVTVPVELRIAGVALGGVGVLYLTVFAALKLYALLPPLAAFALLFVIAAFSSVLAVRQNSIALAAVGVIGGFLAPILTSSESGNHVLLFSYYALLNAGIFAIAWFKAWRILNLLGFVCTFVVGTVWGVTRYRAGDFATTEPFLVLFFLFYVGIAVLYALRRSVEVKHYVDGTLVFGTPLVAAGLQHALVHPFEFGMAGSAVAAAALYLVLARVLWARRRDDLRLLVESFLALGVVFATLAVPLAFDARWTSATWALEGAAIYWVGVRQQRFPARMFGLLLQIAAGVACGLGWTLWSGHAPARALPVVNSDFAGAALIAAAGLVTAWVGYRLVAGLRTWERAIVPVAFAWGTVWWLIAGGREIDRWVPVDVQQSTMVVFLACTAMAFDFACRRLRWTHARVPALLLLPALLAIALAGIARGSAGNWHLFGHAGVFAWGFALLAWVALLMDWDRDAAVDSESTVQRVAHGGLVWLIALLASEEIAWLAARFVTPRGAWHVVPWGLVPALLVVGICALAARPWWPVAAHRSAYLIIGAAPLAASMLLFALVANVATDGNSAPLPYVPLANPLDLTLALVAGALALWALQLGREGIDLHARVPREALYGVPAALAFIWVNALVLRTIHHWYGVPWTFAALWHSTLVQAVLSLLWAIVALAAMVFANRRAARVAWIAGAVLLAVVVIKLFVVDLSRIGGIERIVSFIGVGALLLLIGYLAPVPPRRKEETT